MWKNILVIWRRKFQTLGEIIIPLLFCSVLVFLRVSYTNSQIDRHEEEDVNFHELDVFNTPSRIYEFWHIAYAPKNSLIDNTMSYVKECMKLDNVNGFRTNLELQNFLLQPIYKPIAAVFFDPSKYNSREFTRLNVTFRFEAELRYELVGHHRDTSSGMHWMTNVLAPPPLINGPRNAENEDGGYPPGYYAQYFILLQSCVTKAYIDICYLNRTSFVPTEDMINIQRYSYPKVFIDTLLDFFRHVVPVIVSLSFLYPCVNNVEVRG